MSSSRSIAAARNRRAGEQHSQQPQIARPGTSIAGQPAFSQQSQPQLKRSYTVPNSTPNVPVTSSTNNTTNAKLSISDAIGLITLRLGRVEQILMDVEHNGGFASSSSIPDNSQLVDKSVINSIVNRLDTLEKREKDSSNSKQPNKFEGEIRDIKDLLMNQILKYEKFTSETTKKFDEIKEDMRAFEEAIVSIEQCNVNSCCLNNLTDNAELSLDENSSESTISGNLKSAIEQELADSV